MHPLARPSILALAGLMIAACHDPVDCGAGGRGCAPPPEAAMSAPATDDATDDAPDAREDAERFARALYARMADDAFAPLAGRDAPTVFTAEVVRLIDHARGWTDEGVHPALEADPLCLCQDPHGLTVRHVQADAAGPERAIVRVRFDFGADDPEERRETILDLRREDAAWRVDDIRTDDGFSFLRSLLQPG